MTAVIQITDKVTRSIHLKYLSQDRDRIANKTSYKYKYSREQKI